MAETAGGGGTGGLLKEFCDETTCSICLEHFRDPVTVDCGHNFCRACLTQCWGESDTDPSCPQCRETIPQRNFRPNRQLASLVALVKKLEAGKKAEEKRGECGKHQEPLKLFCKSDEAPICVVCDRSTEHRGHSVVPIEEAAQVYKVKIQAQLQTLEKEREYVVDQKLAEEEKGRKCLAQLGVEKQKVTSTFEQMAKFLQEQESFWLAQLEDLEKEIEKRQEENVTRLSEEIFLLSKLIKEMEEKCQQSANDLLQDIRSTLIRYQKGQVRPPVETSADLEERLKSYSSKHSVLKGAMKKYQAFLEGVLKTESLKQPLKKATLMEVLHTASVKRPLKTVIMSLDPDTSHPFLLLATNLKRVDHKCCNQELPRKPETYNSGYNSQILNQKMYSNAERFDSMTCVLGSERITSGRYHWEVNVENRFMAKWAVGVAQESVPRKGEISFDPQEGIWAVGKVSAVSPQFLAFTSPEPTPLTLSWVPKHVTVVLDYEEGRVEFFDSVTKGLIFTHHSASFSGETIRPFFWLCDGACLMKPGWDFHYD